VPDPLAEPVVIPAVPLLLLPSLTEDGFPPHAAVQMTMPEITTAARAEDLLRKT
jgi:hypothetical protein